MVDDCQVVGVDDGIIWSAVFSASHCKANRIHAYKNRWSAVSGDLGPKCLEDRPGNVWITGTELTESCERGVVWNWDR